VDRLHIEEKTTPRQRRASVLSACRNDCREGHLDGGVRYDGRGATSGDENGWWNESGEDVAWLELDGERGLPE
jgi:hypothetical protein